jgi:UDP-glucose 4-epimerase
VVTAVERVTGQPVQAIRAERRPGDPATLVASSDRIRQVLGWSPRYADLDEIIATAWRWRQAHPGGYGDSES